MTKIIFFRDKNKAYNENYCLSRKENTMNEPITLDWAIQHCLDVAEHETCESCADAHRQLAEWLTELKERRALDACEK